MTGPVSPVELLAPRSDIASLSTELARQGRVRVPQLLQPGLAQSLHVTMAAWRRWALVTRIEGQHRSFDAEAMAEIDPARRAAFEQLVQQEAGRGFQYLFERYPLVDHGRTGQLSDAVLLQAFALLRSEAFLDLARQLLGAPEIRFADGQLTRYRAGHFLSLHDDEAEGLNRVAAYVINLSTTGPRPTVARWNSSARRANRSRPGHQASTRCRCSACPRRTACRWWRQAPPERGCRSPAGSGAVPSRRWETAAEARHHRPGTAPHGCPHSAAANRAAWSIARFASSSPASSAPPITCTGRPCAASASASGRSGSCPAHSTTVSQAIHVGFSRRSP